jgi:phosphomannomutase
MTVEQELEAVDKPVEVRDMAGFENPSSPDSGPEGGTAVLERPEVEEQPDLSDNDGDADRFAHYVSRDRMEQSQLTGKPVVALCGKVWVPKHDPSKYPVCPDCKRIYSEMMQ